ncbi:hypothetical protein BU26DRAFT_564831 [Trematosphaeria pertusa]|uniref:Phospholipase A2 n=1 Tax=Trematosphaeria pertusa TaxID=390896 RepID=A0A6A6IGK9_9PLEO|nr:uncharacterized protein BU26DRAFT_564831 [Trematosphaeria pertusa]KAF2249168.1 hypothetical protein BU26DRAFT_564831 [Trematosphaeria pertusa]
MKAAILTVLGILSVAMAAPSGNLASRETANEATDRLLFSTSISNFETARNAKNPPSLDWSSDGCSSSPDNPLGFDFLYSCHRHDFGYRNYKKQSRFTDAGKAKIDLNFKNDMYNQCESEWLESLCKDFADLYYTVVKEVGSKRAVEIMERESKLKREAKAILEARDRKARTAREE